MTSTPIRLACGIAGALLFMTVRVNSQETLAAARDLYSAAAYEEALQVLDRLESRSQPGDRLAIHQYRAFCLLALGRTLDAERAIETVLATEPLYQPSPADASPRLRSAFSAVRQRMLPTIVQEKYAHAKSAYDQKDFVSAAAGFSQVLDALANPDMGPAAKRPPLSDLGTLAAGFRELSIRAAVPAPPSPQPRAPDTVSNLAPAPATVAPRIYRAGEANVVPPVAVAQELPRFSRSIGVIRSGVLEVVINESGRVEAATLRSSMNPRYDVLALDAARFWKYKPATLNGTPVKFRKTIIVNVKPG